MLNVSLLGGASFSTNGAVVKSDLGPAGRLLACYLFEFSGKIHRRERLADLFWNDTAPDQARSAFNTAIWRIRKLLELGSKGGSTQLLTVGDDVVLQSSQAVQVDTHLLRDASKLIPNGGGDESLREEDEQTLNSAIDRYDGPFLDGYDSDWVLQERERLHCLFVKSTFELMRSATRRGQYERALEFGRRILAVDALRESIQRDVMLLLVLNGQRAEAIRAYRRLANLLQEELEIEPMPESKKLYNDIRSGDIFNRIANYTLTQFRIKSPL